MDKNFENSFSSFDRTKETFGFSAKRRYIVPQVGIYTLYSKSLTLVFKGSVSSIITNFRVSGISVRIVVISFGIGFVKKSV